MIYNANQSVTDDNVAHVKAALEQLEAVEHDNWLPDVKSAKYLLRCMLKEFDKWATWTVQQNNRRSNRIVEYNGSRYTLSSLARTCGIKSSTLRARIEAGWSVKDAVEKPINNMVMDYRRHKMENGSEQE